MHLKTLLILLASSLLCYANTDLRHWTFVDGSKLHAELINYNVNAKTVHLLINDKKEITKSFDEFEDIDRAWLIAWSEFEDHTQDLNEKLGGKTEHIVINGTYETDLFVYYPSAFEKSPQASLPLMFLFHPGGKAARYLYEHMEAAEESNLILVACGQFRNTGDNKDLEAGFLSRFKEVFRTVQKDMSFDPKKVFMGGTSGGAWKAYHYSAWVKYNWAGIYANVGWLGGRKYYDLDYSDGMRVVMVNGNNDRAANSSVKKDSQILDQHGCEVSLISFEGGHQVPPSRTQTKAFKWLLQSEEFDKE